MILISFLKLFFDFCALSNQYHSPRVNELLFGYGPMEIASGGRGEILSCMSDNVSNVLISSESCEGKPVL